MRATLPPLSLTGRLRLVPAFLAAVLGLAALASVAQAQVISVNTTILSGFSTLVGTPSPAQSFNTGGTSLTGNISVIAPTGYEVSLSSGGPYTPTVTLVQAGGTVPVTQVFVRLTGATVGSPSGNVAVASAGATTQNVAVSGTVLSTVSITSGGYDAVRNIPIFPYQITTDPPPPTPTFFVYTATGLPAGLSIDGSTGIISGTPTTVETRQVVLSVFLNTVPPSTTPLASKTVTFRILEIVPPSVLSETRRGDINVPFNYQIVANNSPTSYGASGLPAGLSIDTTTGVISGVPTVSGTFNVGLSATNASGTGTGNLTLNIYPLTDPVIVSGDTTGLLGQPFFYAITVTEESKAIIEYRALGLDLIGGLTLNPATGAITGVPENAGRFSVIITAINLRSVGPPQVTGIGSRQITIEITGASVGLEGSVPQNATYKLLDRVPWNATVRVTDGTTVQAYTWVAYITGADIYGNPVNIEVGRGQVPIISADFTINPGDWTVPNDGTLFNTEAGYFFVVALFEQPPATLADLRSPFLSLTGTMKIDVIPNLAVPSPAIVYPGSDQKQFFVGGDIVQFGSFWRNRPRAERTANGRVQSRPLRPGLDGYTVSLRLSGNAAFEIAADDATAPEEPTTGLEDDEVAGASDDVLDDFDLMEPLLLSGDLGGYTPTGTTQIRRVEVTGTPPGTSSWPAQGALNPYGLQGVTGTERCYDPQPYDGFLDVGEQVYMITEQLIPENYFGRYYVAGRVAMTAAAADAAPGNNIFVSNSDAKIDIAEEPAPTLQTASAISTDVGVFVDSGYNASDKSSVSDSGEAVAFESTANNLLIPPPKAGVFVGALGVGKNMADPANYPVLFGGQSVTYPEIVPFLTVNRQIFFKYNQTGEVVLVSRDITGQQANADCFNPSINAGLAGPNADGETYSGWYVAYDSKASNLGYNNGARSSIYVFNTQTLETVLVSSIYKDKGGRLELESANGDSFRPRISSTGRFVVFQSEATNLDPKVTLPADAGMQVYLHDRNVDGRVDTNGNPDFDQPGNTATYLVSVGEGGVLDDDALRGVVNLNDDEEALLASDGRMYVAFTSCASNAPKPNRPYYTVYRASVKVEGPVSERGAIATELLPISLTPTGNPPLADGLDPVGAVIRPNSDDAAINGDGKIIAFTSAATNLVPDDTNRVPDVFVRDLNLPLDDGGLVRVSVSDERVATGTISFLSTSLPGPGLTCNVPNSQPLPGDSITISDGETSQTFVFGTDLAIGSNVQETRDNLITVINATFPETLFAEPTTPPNTLDLNGLPSPGLGYNASIYLKNKTPGTAGNVPITVSLVPAIGRTSAIFASGMQGGGRQAEDDALDPGNWGAPPIQGVPFGSSQPSIDRSGYRIVFRSIATNLDVHRADLCETVPPLPPFPLATVQQETLVTGELIRPLLFPTANVYLHDRLMDEAAGLPDVEWNTRTERVSVNKFGYETLIFGKEPTGINARTSAANHSPAISANGRFVGFSSDSTAKGGLIFGDNNRDFPVTRNVRNVFVQDRRTVGENPPEPTTRPIVELAAPTNGQKVPPGTVVPINATASATLGKTIESVRLFINGAQFGDPLLQGPYSWSFTLPNAGTYFIRVVATDSRGVSSSDSAIIFAQAPTGEAPAVGLTQPTSEVTRFVLGSEFIFNLTATDSGGIAPGTANFFVNGAPLAGTLEFNDTYVAGPYRPGSFGDYSISAAATDTDGNTVISPPTVLSIAAPGRTLPFVEILPLDPQVPLVAGGRINLRAAVQLFGPDPGQTIVQFYADGVYIGDGVLQEETGLYFLNWRLPQEARAFARVQARVIAPNSVTLVPDPADPAADPKESANFASVVSDNFLTFDTIDADPLDVDFIKPADNAEVPVGLPLLLEVAASAPAGQGTIARVEFYQNGELITSTTQNVLPDGTIESGVSQAIDTTFPYQFTFSPPSPGQYTLVALAFSTAGVVEQSDSITINAVSGDAPTVEITTPQDGLTTPQTTLSIGWRAGDTDGSVEKAQLLVNGAPAVGSNGAPLEIDRAIDPASNPGSNVLTYTPPSEGQYDFVVRATDNLGNVTDSDPVTVTVDNTAVNPLPAVSLTQPLGVSYVAVGSEFYAAASAVPVAPKTIDTVSFYLNGQLITAPTGSYGDSYAARFTITERKAFIFDEGTFNQLAVGGNELFGEAKDSDDLLNATQVYRIASYGARNPLPTVTMLPLYGGSDEVSIGGNVILQARPVFPTAANQEPAVEFYANGVSIGLGTKNTNNDDYSLQWSPTEEGPFIITARAQSVNWTSSSVFDEVINGTKVVGSSISDNFITINTTPGVQPDVEITSPTTGASVPINVPVSIKATAVVPPGGQGAIEKVEFYQNGILIGEPDVQAPFQVEFTPPSPGTYTLIAVAYGTSGLIGSSTTVQFNAASGAAPTVSIRTPPDGLTTPQATLNIAYAASDSDGSVQRVDLLVNDQLRGSLDATRGQVGQGVFSYLPPSQGLYKIVVRATDNVGNVTDSVPSVVTVDNSKPRVLPEVVISQQTIAEGGYVAGSEVFLNATARAFGTNSILTNGVTFYANGSPLGGEFTGFSNSTGQVFSARDYLDSPGEVFYDVLAEDTAGQLASDQTQVSVEFSKQPLPTVQMLKPVVLTTNPVVLTTNPAGGFIKLQAEAIFPVSAAEQRVEFYVNGKLEGVGAPGTNAVVGTNLFEFNWRSPANTASFRVDARAVCLNFEENVLGGGGSGTNAATNVTRFYSSVISDVPTHVTTGKAIPPTVIVKSPIDGAFVPVGSAITLQATASVVGSTIRRVEFYGNGDLIGFSENAANAYSVNYTPSSKGEVVIVAVAETVRGIRGESTPVTIKVPFEGDPTVEITAPVAGTIFPPGTTFTAAAEVAINEVTKAPIRDVRFFLNEVEILPSVNAVDPQTGAATTQPGQPDNTAPYSAQVTLQGVGNYFLKAIATDIYGNTDAEEIVVVCGLPPGGGTSPVVYMTHPTPAGQTADGNIDNVNDFSTPSQFFFNAKIVLPSNASIDDPSEDVKFFANGQPLGESGGIPAEVRGVKEYDGSYSIYWQPPGNGTYDITAQATATFTDKNGNKSKITAVSSPLFFDIGNVARFIPSIKLRPIGNGAVTVNSRVLIQTETNQGPEPIDRIDFYADGVLIGSAAPRDVDNTPVTTTFEWIPRTPSKPGKPYIISARAVQVVEGGADFGADNSVISNPVMLEVTASSGSTPLVNLLQQPISETLYVYGSQLFLNATVAARGTATIPADGVKFYYNSEVLDAPKSGVLFGLQNVYSTKVLVEDSVPEITLFATARDSNNATSSSSVATLQADRPLFPLPEAEMLPLFGPGPFSAGEDVVLRARAEFPPTAASEARVEFYANGAYLGAGVEDPQNPGIYIFTWETPETSGDYVIEARAVALNFTRNIEDNNSLRFFGSSISLNSVTAPVQAVPSVLVPGSNGAFVVDIYNELLYRDPSYIEWFEATDALDAGVIDRASFVMTLMGFDPVRKVFNRQVEFGRTVMTACLPFYRLGLTPTEGQILSFITILEADDRPLPIFGSSDGGGGGGGETGGSDYSGIPDAPWGATYGMGTAMQNVVLRSAQFRLKYPAVSGLANLAFNEWLRNTMFRGVSGGDETLIIEMMNTIFPQNIRQGAAMAFRSEFAWVSLESDYTVAPEQQIQLQAATTILNFQLNGVWDAAYGKKNPYSKKVVESLLSSVGLSSSGATPAFRGPPRSYQGVIGSGPAVASASTKSVAASMTPRVSGEVRVSTTATGTYSATLTLANGAVHRFKGLLKGDGSIQDQWAPGLSVNLAPVEDTAAKYLGGTVSFGSNAATAVAGRLIYSKDAPFGSPGNYTLSLRIDPAPAADARLQGSGYATVKISSAGVARFAGRLADNTPFTGSFPVWGATGEPGEQALLVHRALSKGAGAIGGRISRRNGGVGSGEMIWNVAPTAVGTGGELSLEATLSLYRGISNGSVLPFGWPWNASFSLDWNAGSEFGAVGFVMPGTLFGSDAGLVLKVNTSSGLVGGSFIDAETGAKYKIGGILDQATKTIDGFFLTPQSSGRLEINR